MFIFFILVYCWSPFLKLSFHNISTIASIATSSYLICVMLCMAWGKNGSFSIAMGFIREFVD